MEWYKTLDIHMRINAKECFKLCCGVTFEEMGCLFSLKERMNIMYNKLKMEGFEV